MRAIFFLILLLSPFSPAQSATEIIHLGNSTGSGVNRSPSITGPATEYPKNPGENGAYYSSSGTVEKQKPRTFSWRRASVLDRKPAFKKPKGKRR